MRSVKSVARSVVVRAAADVREREVLEEEVARRQMVVLAELVVGLAKAEVHLLMRRNDAVAGSVRPSACALAGVTVIT